VSSFVRSAQRHAAILRHCYVNGNTIDSSGTPLTVHASEMPADWAELRSVYTYSALAPSIAVLVRDTLLRCTRSTNYTMRIDSWPAMKQSNKINSKTKNKSAFYRPFRYCSILTAVLAYVKSKKIYKKMLNYVFLSNRTWWQVKKNHFCAFWTTFILLILTFIVL